jgi:hypothetical protein
MVKWWLGDRSFPESFVNFVFSKPFLQNDDVGEDVGKGFMA